MSRTQVSFLGIGVGMMLLGYVSTAYAEGPIIRSAPSISVASDQVLTGDFYGAGETVVLSGTAEQDAYIIGGTVTVNAPVKQDLVVAGGAVQVHGDVSDDIRVLGGEVVIAGKVAGDVLAIGGTVHILSTAEITGDLVFFGGTMRIEGPVKGSLYGTADELRIDARIEGDVTVTTKSSLTLGGSGVVEGSLTYTSAHELIRAQDAQILGEISRQAPSVVPEMSAAQASIFGALILVFASLTLFFLSRRRLESFVQASAQQYGRFGLVGLGVFFALPFIALLLMSSIVGLLVGGVLLTFYLLAILIGCALMPVVLGSLVWYLFKKEISVQIGTIGIGVLVVELFQLLNFVVPVIGALCLAVAFLVSFGGFLTLSFYSLRKE
jgi:cytoskeletal protein CcmA (bactofilin family)